MRFYITKLGIRHRITTFYHSRTNGKVENLNDTLKRILTKLMMGKSTKLWDKYLSQTLFSARVRIHAISKISPFYFIYGIHPRIPFNANLSRLEKLIINAE
jgi:transposase InsO family protein